MKKYLSVIVLAFCICLQITASQTGAGEPGLEEPDVIILEAAGTAEDGMLLSEDTSVMNDLIVPVDSPVMNDVTLPEDVFEDEDLIFPDDVFENEDLIFPEDDTALRQQEEEEDLPAEWDEEKLSETKELSEDTAEDETEDLTENTESEIVIPDDLTENTENGMETRSDELGELYASGECGQNLTWTLDTEGTLTVSGSGAMTSYDVYIDEGDEDDTDNFPWSAYRQYAIRKVVIEDGVSSISRAAFWDCENLTEVVIGDDVLTIHDQAFFYCENLKKVSFGASIIAIDISAFDGCILLEEVEFPASLKTIGQDAFFGCESLEKVKFGGNETEIGATAFALCQSLTKLIIPATVEVIDEGAFDSCDELEIHFRGKAPQFGEDVFLDDTVTAYYIVGNGTWTENVRDDYGAEEIEWKEEELVYEIEDHVLTIYAWSSEVFDFEAPQEQPWFDERADIYKIIVEKEAEKVSQYAFSGMSNVDTVVFKGDGRYIGMQAFTNVTAEVFLDHRASLWSDKWGVDFGGNLTWIEWEIRGSTLEIYERGTKPEVTSPHRAGSVPWLEYSNRINEISFMGESTYIGNDWFSKMTELKSVLIPRDILYIQPYAFAECINLEAVRFSAGVEEMGSNVFFGCPQLKVVCIDRTEHAILPASMGKSVFGNAQVSIYYYLQDNADAYTKEEVKEYGGNASWIAWRTDKYNDDLALIIEGFGDLKTAGEYEAKATQISLKEFLPWYEVRNSVSAIWVQGDVRSIGRYAFYRFFKTYRLTLLSEVKKLEEFAFGELGLVLRKNFDNKVLVKSCSADGTTVLLTYAPSSVAPTVFGAGPEGYTKALSDYQEITYGDLSGAEQRIVYNERNGYIDLYCNQSHSGWEYLETVSFARPNLGLVYTPLRDRYGKNGEFLWNGIWENRATYYLSEASESRLLSASKLSKAEKRRVQYEEKKESVWPWAKSKKHRYSHNTDDSSDGYEEGDNEFVSNGGSCHGLALVIGLAQAGVITWEGERNMSDPSTADFVNFYHMQQYLPRFWDGKKAFQKQSAEKQIRKLMELIGNVTEDKSHMVLVSFHFNPYGHSVLGYDIEDGYFRLNGRVYRHRVRTYDEQVNVIISQDDGEKNPQAFDIYFNDDTETDPWTWYIPRYPADSTVKDDVFMFIADCNDLNLVDYRTGQYTELQKSSYLYDASGSVQTKTVGNMALDDHNYTLECSGKSYHLAAEAGADLVTDDFAVTYDENGTRYLCLEESAGSFTLRTDEPDWMISVLVGDHYVRTGSDTAGAFSYNAAADSAQLTLSEKGAGVLEYISDDNTWNEKNQDVQLLCSAMTSLAVIGTADGLSLKSDGLFGVEVYCPDNKAHKEKYYQIPSEQALLNLTGEDPEALIDQDGDGTYETPVPPSEKPVEDPPVNPGDGQTDPGQGGGGNASQEPSGTPVAEVPTAQAIAAGTTATVGNLTYMVTGPGTAACTGTANSKITAVVIPETVVISGQVFAVTSIGDNAFAKLKKLKKVTIGKNVSVIGSKAFFNSRKLLTVKIKTRQLQKIGSRAFSKTGSSNYKKLKVTVPKAKLKSYTKMLKKAKLSSKAAVKKG